MCVRDQGYVGGALPDRAAAGEVMNHQEIMTCQFCGIQHYATSNLMSGDGPHRCQQDNLFRRIRELISANDAANQRILDYESEIGAVCPEDFSLKETIGSFKRELSILQMGREALLRRAEAAEEKLANAREAMR